MNQLINGPRDTKAEESEGLTYKDCMEKKMEVAAPLHLHTVVDDQIRQQDHSYVTPATVRTPLAASWSGSDPEKSPAHIPPRVEYSMEKHFSRGWKEDKQMQKKTIRVTALAQNAGLGAPCSQGLDFLILTLQTYRMYHLPQWVFGTCLAHW